MRRSSTPLVASACAGLAAWCSMGSLAVARADAGVVRFGLLPPLWLLPILVLAGAAIALALRLSAPTSRPLLFSLILVLPWLPIPVPAAFLMWSGHVAVAVWAAVAGGMLAARGIRWPSWMSDARRAPRVAAVVACVLYGASGSWMSAILPGGDEPHYLIITQSLLKDHDLQIENNHERGDNLEYFRAVLKPDFLQRGANGQIYSIHAPGLPAVVLPAFALMGYPGVVLFLSIVVGLGSALLWRSAYVLTESASAAWFGWAAGALTTPFFFEAFAVYPDALGATLLLFAIGPLLEREPRHLGKTRWLLVGGSLALLPWLHTRFAIIAAAVGLFLGLRLIGTAHGRSQLVTFLSVPVVSALGWFGFFRRIYGTFNPAAPYGSYTQSQPANILNGLPALFLDQQFGILPYAPIYGFCLAGLVVMAWHRPRLALELAITAGAYLLSASAYQMWWGGSSAPARFASTILPLLALPGAWLWASARHGSTRAMAVALLAVSVAMTAALVCVEGGRLAYNFRDGYSLAAERFSAVVDLPQGLPTFFRQTTAGAVLRAAIWLLAVLGAWVVLRFVERRASQSGPALALATPTCLAAAIMLALGIVWSIDRVSAATPETSQLTLLEDYNPRVRPLGLTMVPLRFESADSVLSRLSISTPTRRPAPPARTLLIAPGIVPAGQYELRMKNPSPASGTARLVIGRLARPINVWNLASDFQDGSVEFDLPVAVGSLVVEGDDEAARTSGGGLVLRPTRVLSGGARLTDGYARRVERYGPAFAYFLDDGSFPEVPGFWVRGGAGSTIAVMPAERGAPVRLFVRNAPVANRVIVEIDGREQVLDLQPREERTVPVRPAADRRAALIRFRTSSGFRPSEVEPGSTDSRFLGVWIEFR